MFIHLSVYLAARPTVTHPPNEGRCLIRRRCGWRLTLPRSLSPLKAFLELQFASAPELGCQIFTPPGGVIFRNSESHFGQALWVWWVGGGCGKGPGCTDHALISTWALPVCQALYTCCLQIVSLRLVLL